VPAEVIRQWEQERRHDEEARLRYWQELERALDAGHGEQWLAKPGAGGAVVETLLKAHGKTCRLHAFVVMPTHCHLLATVEQGVKIGDWVKGIKGASARRVNETLCRTGRLWQEDYFDRAVKSDDQFRRTAEYIEWNPVKAGLCSVPERYFASSANPKWRFYLGGDIQGRAEARPPGAD
jgi:REP element-mobilizing transposase RayT